MSVSNFFFARSSNQAAIAAAILNNWCWKKVSVCFPSSFIAKFYTNGLLSLPQSEIRAGKLLVDPGHLQELHVVGRPHNRYRRARRHCSVVDRALQKNTYG